jgi:hypothetical protein
MVLDRVPVARAGAGDADEQTPATSSCCCCKAEKPASDSSQPRPSEAPPAPCHSDKCCWDRHTTPPTHPQQFQPDYSVVAVLPVADALLTPVCQPAEITLRALPVSPPIHVFDCVWLC